ncbi:TonB family protein [Ferribacterium limneticum]|uniref:TonB family protein n=1 Tax=Ferribacterium limneticum TaxID=76259 RepID=UPI001CF84297|nr:TonB family protein [Ferribacterium limneticum]UCV21350.1 TonB family protein [Ferribacterium limneticum]
METEIKPSRRWLNIVVIIVVGASIIAIVTWGIMTLMGSKSGKPRKPPVVTLLPDKPPPPPPPPKEEKKPEPPKENPKDVKMEPPKEAPQPAQNEPLKMEGAAGDGDGPFGSGTVGRDYQGGAANTLGGGAAFAFYTNLVQRHLQEELGRNRRLKITDYRVVVRIWLTRAGVVQKAELAASTGDLEVDESIRAALLNAGALRELPPENLPQPLKIRITNRGSA